MVHFVNKSKLQHLGLTHRLHRALHCHPALLLLHYSNPNPSPNPSPILILTPIQARGSHVLALTLDKGTRLDSNPNAIPNPILTEALTLALTLALTIALTLAASPHPGPGPRPTVTP